MKYGKSMIILVIAIFIFTIATASAGDVNDTIVTSENMGQMGLSVNNDISADNLQTSDENNKLELENINVNVNAQTDNNVLSDNDNSTYSGLSSEIGSGGNIALTHDYYTYDSGSTIVISIDNSVIEGNGAIIDMAGSNMRAFNVTASSVTIKNLTIKNGNVSDNGGAIYFEKAGTVENCNFVNNNASEYFRGGGAIYFYGAGNVINCNFTGNTATGDGGAVYFYQGTGSVTNCNFTNNTASGEGGAIRFSGEGTVTNCNFTNNTASQRGGAVYFYDEGTVSNCNFTNNSARYGGAIEFDVTGTVSNCNFTDNQATDDGGAVYFDNTGSAINCNFTGNTATYGGAIRMYSGSVSNCNFTNNTASYDGGAIYFVNTGTVTNCNFTGNNATTGSAIYFYKGDSSDTLTVSDSTFLNNRANAEALDVVKNDNNITITFNGQNNLLNAIYSRNDAEVAFTNVKYWGANGITTVSATLSGSNKAAGQNITVGIVVNDEIVLNQVYVTDENGTIVLNINAGENYYIGARHGTDSYYTEAEKAISNNTKFSVNVTSQTTNNKTVNITAKSNIFSEVMPGKLLFILPNGTSINATYGANGTWWAVHTFEDYDVYRLSASYIGLNGVTVNKGTITINKADSKITLENITLNYGENINLTIPTEGATGITAKIDNVDVDVENKFTVLISGLNGGNHTLTVSTVPDEDHLSVTETATIIVNKLPTEIILANETLDLKVMDIGHILAKLTPEGGGNLTYVSSDVSVVTVDDKGNVNAIGGGNATIIVSFAGNDNYTAAKDAVVTVCVSKFDTAIDVDASTDENNVIITAAVDKNASGLIKFNIGGKVVYVDVNGGEAVYDIILPSGNYTVEATYVGDNKFNSNTTSKEFTIAGHVKKNTPITAEAKPGVNRVTITVNVDENATGFVNIKFADNEFNVALTGGAGSLTVNLPANSYSVDVTYLGDVNFNENMTELSFTVAGPVKENTPISLDVSSVENNATFTVDVSSDATGIVRFEVSGAEEYTVYADVIEGQAVMGDVLSVGDYTVVATYLGDSRFNSNITSESFFIKGHVKKDTQISADVKVSGNRVTITVDVDENATGFVGLKLAGSTVYVPVENGVASYVSTFDAGSYNIEVTYVGDDDFNENTTRVLFTVVEVAKENTFITLNVSSVENNATFTVDVSSDATGIVRFEVSGAENYIVYADVIDGKAVMEDVLMAGDYRVVATYMGDSRFNSNATSGSFNVKGHVKKDTPVSANVSMNGNKVTIAVNVDANATGFVNIKFVDNEFNVALNDGAGSLTVNLPASSYSVDVTYLGDDNFNGNMTKLSFTVADPVKENTPISLVVYSVENNVTFTVNLNSDATGIVRFEVSGAEEYTVYADVIEGQAVMGDVLSVGDYTVVATYLGDSRFNSNITSESFTIKGHVKKDTQISADVKVSGSRVTITVDVDENATGFVGLKLAGSTVYVPVENGVASYVATFDAGSYNVVATYLGDDDFNENTTRVLFTVVEVAKENTFITLNVSSVENNATFTVDVSSDATGIVRFEVSGAEVYTVYADVIDGKAVMDDVLLSGEYTVVATYMGDSRFNSNATSGSFNVKGHVKKDTPVSANVSMNGNKVTIAVNVDANATGFVNIKFADNEFNVALNDGAGSLTVNLPASSYSVDVAYIGDDNFNGNMTELSFTVADPVKENTPISLDVSSVENNVTFTVDVISDATGIVRFEVSGAEVYTVYADVIEGQAVMGDVLSVGDYTVVATYLGDSRFNSNITSESFTIKGHVKKDTQISADVKVSGNRVTITVDVDENATGFVGLKQSSSTVYVPVENGVASYVATFDAGSYNVVATYLGDDDFNENTTRVLFTVVEAAKENTFITLNVSSVENNATFTVDVSSDATGIVRFEVSGAENYIVYADVIDGKAVMEDVLMAGDYRVVATYMGDSRFNSNATSGSFTVKGHVKKDTQISADVKVSGNRVSITVNVDANATGFVNIKFVDNEFNVALTGGAGSLTVNLPASSYSVDVAYIGDDNFNGNMTKLSFTVADPVKENTTIALVVYSVENNATFTVNLNSDATGIVRFEVSGAEVYTVYSDVIDGKAVMGDVLSVGDYTVVATYLGDSRFNSNITSESFTIKGHVKKDTQISADAKVSGNRVTISINVDTNATGFVGLKLLGSTIYVPVENGVATYINTFATGSYNVEVTYTGDDDFNENSTRVLFTVVEAAKKNTPIALDVSSVENNVTFTVDVDSDATGIVRFEVSGAENYAVYADVVDGRAVMEDVISAGEYSVVATYMGDSKFNSNSTTSSFTILNHVKINTLIKAVPTVDGNTVTITATVDSNATGFVTFGVLGQRFMIPVNDGKAVFTFDFASGTYAANVVYLGDDNFNNASTTATFTVIKQVVELKNTTLDVSVDSVENDVSIIAKVDSLASGLVEFVIDGEAVYIAVNNGEAAYEVVLPAGDYNVVVTYLGDDKFNPNSTVKAFTVVDHIKKNTTISSDVVLDGNNVTLTVSVNKDASGFVKFTLGGRNVFAEVADGKAVINVIVSEGSYDVDAVYLGDDEFNENVTVISFTVEAPESSDVSITVPSDVKAGESANVTVDIANATGNVTVIVDGKETTVPLVNGSASVPLENISAGDHSVVVVYSGDETHAPTHSSSSFSVPEEKVIQPVATGFADIVIFSDSTVSAVLVDETGKGIANATVIYSVGSESGFVVTDANGVFTIKGESGVVMAIGYAGDADYLATNTTIKFDNVAPAVRQSTVIVGNNYTQYAIEYDAGERGQNFTVQLKDANGNVLANKEVLIGYNGKTLYRTTNATGYASVQINLRDKNRLTFAVTFLGDENYNATMSVYLITIQQKPVTIKASAKTFKVSAKTKKYTVTLKTIKGASADGKTYFAAGKKVTMKINGKTYTAKTNAKGQATFSLKITKKGKFAASIKYAGDNTYKAASKSVKITIK